MFRYDEFRRPGFWQVDMNFAKTTPITDKMRMQIRLEAFNLFNSPMYDERNYNQSTTTSRVGTYGQYSIGLAGQIVNTGWLGFVRVDYRNGDRIEGLSGTGPKAGGPHYVARFATERV